MPSFTDIFAGDGALAARLPGFTHRAAQTEMAERVAEALQNGRHLAIEAGTGIGKTFAYLVPVLASGRRAIISTGTRTLQDQLFARDLPMLGGAIGRPVAVAMLKGRGNYLCWHRLEVARGDGARDAHLLDALETVAAWGRSSTSGDLTELRELAEEGAVRAWVSSTADNCLGSRCERLHDCFLFEARRRAQGADVVIVNHHLLLADLALKDAGFGDLLPGADAVIVDEAHLLPEIAQQFFGMGVSSRELQSLARDVTAEARSAGLASDLEPLADVLMRSVAEARLVVDGAASGRVPWRSAPPALPGLLDEWRDHLSALAAGLEGCREASSGLLRCWERSREAFERLEMLHGSAGEEGLKWCELSPRNVAVHWTPLDTGESLGERIRSQGGTWVFTSATLAVGDDFRHFLQRVGIEEAHTAVLPSPFDYHENARLYLPQGLPEPHSADHVESLLHEVWPLLEACRGGVFLLFTSYRALQIAHGWLERRPLPGPLLAQGNGARTELLEQFRRAGDAVLLGTSSFWQGVDVRGPALRMVVIDKLPFASPGDPLVQARLDAVRRRGGDPFVEFQLPQAVLALKQGVGRLIRDFEDRGLIVLGDPRLRTRPYGRVFLASLPPMRLLEDLDEALAFAAKLPPSPIAAQRIARP